LALKNALFDYLTNFTRVSSFFSFPQDKFHLSLAEAGCYQRHEAKLFSIERKEPMESIWKLEIQTKSAL
jgi:hypothetical protein